MELDHEFTVPVPVDRAWSVLLDLERVAPCVPGATLDTIQGDEFTGRLKVKLGAMTITYKGTARIVVADEAARIVTIEGSAKEARGSGTASATVQAQLHEEGDNTRVTVHTKLNITGRPAQFGRNILAEVGAKLISRFADALAKELQVPDEERQAPAAEAQTAAAGAAGSEAASQAPAQAQPKAEAELKAQVSENQAEPQATAGIGRPTEEPVALDERAPTAEAPAEATGQPVEVPKAAQTIPDGFAAPEKPALSADEGADKDADKGGAAERVAVTPRPVRHSEEAIDLLEVAGPSVVKRAAPVFGGLIALLTVRYLFRRRRGRHHR